MKPRLAESYEVSEDHLIYTFNLRKGVTFSDGKPFTAEDVKFSFDIMMDPKTDSLSLRNYFANVDRCEIIDPHTIRFVCKEPYFKTLISLSEDIKILPKHIFGTGDINKHEYNRKPIGTGPYILDSWEANTRVVLTRT